MATSFAYSQTLSWVIKGRVSDSETKQAVEGSVNIRVIDHYLGEKTNREGYYELALPKKNSFQLEFSHIGYSTQSKTIYRYQFKNSDTLELNIELVFSPFELETIEIADKPIPVPVFKSEKESVADFEFYGENLLLLTYEKRLEKESKVLYVTEEQDLISSFFVPGLAKELYTDFLGNVYAVCEEKIFQIEIKNDNLVLFEISVDDFETIIKPCVDTLAENIYFSTYNPDFPAFDYYAFNTMDSTYKYLQYIVHDYHMEIFRAEYKYMSGRDKLEAFRKELETGIDKEIIAGFMTGYSRSMNYKPLYAPLFVIKDTVMIFDHYSGQLFKYDPAHQPIDSISIDYFNTRKRSEWRQQLLKDEITDRIYAVFQRVGKMYLKEISTETGKVIGENQLYYRYVENTKIKDGYAYYIYRPFESTQKKYLYRELLKN